MPNVVEFIAGEGINIETNTSGSTVKFTGKLPLTDDQKEALNNDKASGSNKFLTVSEANAKIDDASNEPTVPPKNFPKFFTSSTNYTIPKSGKYKISAVGGGGSGAIQHINVSSHGKNGSDTKIIIAGETYIAKGGAGGKYFTHINEVPVIDIPYDGTKGSTRGGRIYGGNKEVFNFADNGHGLGGGFNGGGGSLLNYKTLIKVATASIIHKTVGNDINYETFISSGHNSPQSNKYYVMRAGYGYGAGSGACSVAINFNISGGNSGYLITKELQLVKGTSMKIIIGAGGPGVSGTYVNPHPVNDSTIVTSGNGAQGAVLLEWIGN